MADLTITQQRLLVMMDWFHNYCSEHQLTYYMIGGTMLGAVRHKGFIPWDDDIDVGMPREDYTRFIDLMEGKKDGIYIVETFRSKNLDYYVPFAKIYDTSTTLVEDRNPPLKRGLFLDVFPLDGAKDTLSWKAGYKVFRVQKNLLSVLSAKKQKTYSAKTNFLIGLVSAIPQKGVFCNQLQQHIDRFCQSAPFSTEGTVANLVGSRKEKELLPGKVFGRPTLYLFEGREYYGVELADQYLSMLIGDYMQLPPEKDRRGHLITDCDYDHGYMD